MAQGLNCELYVKTGIRRFTAVELIIIVVIQ